LWLAGTRKVGALYGTIEGSPAIRPGEGQHNTSHCLNFMDLIVLDLEDVSPMTRARRKVPIHCIEPRNAYNFDCVLLFRSPENAQPEHEAGLRVGDGDTAIVDSLDVAEGACTHLGSATQDENLVPFRECLGKRRI